jgi:formiminotetrahydrofolate cyclodeaminase
VLIKKTLKDFLDDVASKSPAPGGGSTAALAGSLSASLVSMVCHLTIGKKGYDNVENHMKKTLLKSEDIRKKLIDLIDKDTNAFDGVIAAFRMPKNTEKEQKERKQAIQDGYKTAADVPLTTANYCDQLWEHIKIVAEKGNKNSLSDAGVASLLNYAGFKGAIFNVQINLDSIKDQIYTTEVKKKIRNLEKRASLYQKEIMDCINL